MVQHWRPILPSYFWNTDDLSSPWVVHLLPGSFWLAHLYSWLVILVSFVVMDLPDLMGIRPIYHRVFLEEEEDGNRQNRHQLCDFQYLSPEHSGLRLRFRHGSFLAFSAILLLRRRMGADRVILAAGLAAYMYARFRPTAKDWQYQVRMWQNKKRLMT